MFNWLMWFLLHITFSELSVETLKTLFRIVSTSLSITSCQDDLRYFSSVVIILMSVLVKKTINGEVHLSLY